LFEGVFHGLYAKISSSLPAQRRKFRFKNKLVSIDSTVVDLSVSMYDWAHYQRTKGAVKLHLVLDHDGYLPCFGVVTDGTVHDVKVAQELRFTPGTIVGTTAATTTTCCSRAGATRACSSSRA
jgi:hypothetical protein